MLKNVNKIKVRINVSFGNPLVLRKTYGLLRHFNRYRPIENHNKLAHWYILNNCGKRRMVVQETNSNASQHCKINFLTSPTITCVGNNPSEIGIESYLRITVILKRSLPALSWPPAGRSIVLFFSSASVADPQGLQLHWTVL